MEKALLTTAEAAEMLGIGRTKFLELMRSGAIDSIRIGRCVRVPVKSIHAWITAETQQAEESRREG